MPASAADSVRFGKPQDANTGLDIIGARNYDPATGRFISVDPVFEQNSPQQLNGYTYAADNPITNSDPSGLCAQFPACNGVPQPGSHKPGKSLIPCGQPGGAACQSPSPGDGGGGNGGSGGTGGSSGDGVVSISQHVSVSNGDPRLHALQAAFQWAAAYEAQIHGAQDEFDIWWRACTSWAFSYSANMPWNWTSRCPDRPSASAHAPAHLRHQLCRGGPARRPDRRASCWPADDDAPERARQNLDRHPDYVLAAYMASGT